MDAALRDDEFDVTPKSWIEEEPSPAFLDPARFDQLCDRLFHGDDDEDWLGECRVRGGEQAARAEPRHAGTSAATCETPAKGPETASLQTARRRTAIRSKAQSAPGAGALNATRSKVQRKHRLWLRVAGIASLAFGLLASALFLERGIATSKVATKPIEQLRVGNCVLGANPLAEETESDTPRNDPAQWRHVRLRMPEDDGSTVEIDLLRSAEWLRDLGVERGGRIYLDLAELGAAGWAEVLDVGACPEITSHNGNVVTGTFRHRSRESLNLRVSGCSEPIGVTANHPIWSATRRQFVPAGELRVGEELKTLSGDICNVTSITQRGVPEDVYNIEVNGQHVYHVGELGVLVHNKALRGLKRPGPGEDLYVGPYGRSYRGNLRTGLNATHTPHHAVQDAVGSAPRHRGPTINIKKTIHDLTRTKNVNADLGSPRRILAADVRDLRKLLLDEGYVRSFINQQLKELIRLNDL